ncbi:MAG TPA: hypothetical protein VMW75_10035, partial [Thermoanaerobaculia bacterium]|nr:hypothetical protein [Thermoanaerobaculia bacterium]
VEASTMAVAALAGLLRTVAQARKHLNATLTICGIFACRVDPRTVLALVACRPEDQPAYDRFAQTVRTASPGSTVYVPKPYPATDPQVIQDFLYQYQSFHLERADPGKLLPGELPLLNGTLNGTVSFSVQKVANWTDLNCGREQRRDFFYLVRSSMPRAARSCHGPRSIPAGCCQREEMPPAPSRFSPCRIRKRPCRRSPPTR